MVVEKQRDIFYATHYSHWQPFTEGLLCASHHSKGFTCINSFTIIRPIFLVYRWGNSVKTGIPSCSQVSLGTKVTEYEGCRGLSQSFFPYSSLVEETEANRVEVEIEHHLQATHSKWMTRSEPRCPGSRFSALFTKYCSPWKGSWKGTALYWIRVVVLIRARVLPSFQSIGYINHYQFLFG